jgi:hypothetical protein
LLNVVLDIFKVKIEPQAFHWGIEMGCVTQMYYKKKSPRWEGFRNKDREEAINELLHHRHRLRLPSWPHSWWGGDEPLSALHDL